MDARKAKRTGMCDLSVPVAEVIWKIAAGNPQGRLAAKKTFA